MGIPVHEISVVAAGVRIPGFKDYVISVDLLQPADSFSMSVRFTVEAWELLLVDQTITVFVDDTAILSGFIDERMKLPNLGGGTLIRINGRDKSGRLVDESAPLFRYGGLFLRDLALKIIGAGRADALFEDVILDNASNRRLVRGFRSRQVTVEKEPVADQIRGTYDPITGKGAVVNPNLQPEFGPREAQVITSRTVIPGIFGGRARPKKVTPGMSRWAVLELFLKEARLLAWSTADGRKLVIAPPAYDQDPQYMFFEASADGDNRDETNCAITVRESVAERYSKITAVGSSSASRSSYGRNVTKRRFTVYQNPDNAANDGIGLAFGQSKSLIVTDDGIRSAKDAQERAERELLEREATGLEVTVEAPGHGQIYSGEVATIFAVDTMATVIDDDTATDGPFLVTAIEFTENRDTGTKSLLTLVPKGTLLQL